MDNEEPKRLKVVEFATETCGVCKMVDPIVQKVVDIQGERIVFEKRVITWDDPAVEKYNIMQAPTFVFLDGENVLYKHSGAITMSFFNKLISDNIAKIQQ